MGGGSWGGGGGGGGSYSGGGGYSSSGGSYSSGRRGGDAGAVAAVGLSVMALLIIGAAIDSSRERRGSTGSMGSGSADVTVLRVALDGRARKFVQAQLARIAKAADTKTAAGRHAMLAEVTLLLRRVRDAWVYGGAVNEPMRSMAATKTVFDQHVMDARARFRTETVRNADGVISTQAAPASIPRPHEGEGLILVSIIVAARTELVTVKHIGDGETLRKALEAAAYRSPDDLIAIEIVWQPSDDADRLSSVELEAKYPRPALIPLDGALVGKTFCAYCSGPYPAELLTCPHCGGPSEGHTTSRAA